MLWEYALEPKLLSKWASDIRDYRECLEKYGLGTPRIISSFPKSKASKLRRYLLKQGPVDEQSSHCQRYIELVEKLVESCVFRNTEAANADKWDIAVSNEHTRQPFDAILATLPLKDLDCLTPENMYEPGSIWNHKSQQIVRRTTPDLLEAFSGLLKLSTQNIVIVDPFGWTSEATHFNQKLLDYVVETHKNQEVPNIVLYYKEKRGGANSGKGSPNADHVRQEVLGTSGKRNSLNFEVYELQEIAGKDVFHNRCIMSENGGIITGHGIGVSEDGAHTDVAILMDKEIYVKNWNQFREEETFRVLSHSANP